MQQKIVLQELEHSNATYCNYCVAMFFGKQSSPRQTHNKKKQHHHFGLNNSSLWELGYDSAWHTETLPKPRTFWKHQLRRYQAIWRIPSSERKIIFQGALFWRRNFEPFKLFSRKDLSLLSPASPIIKRKTLELLDRPWSDCVYDKPTWLFVWNWSKFTFTALFFLTSSLLMVEPTQLKNIWIKLDHFPTISGRFTENISRVATT